MNFVPTLASSRPKWAKQKLKLLCLKKRVQASLAKLPLLAGSPPPPGRWERFAERTRPNAAHDALAVAFVGTLLAPLLVGFAAYTLAHQAFAGWLDWALTTAVSAVYALGFALMTPQLYINYKLRSVAHMPWAVLGYRFFSTIIDDLFAALVKMPLVARISVFRDDVIFVIYMVQRFYYPVDASRPAEVFDADESAAALSAAAADALQAAPQATPQATPQAQAQTQGAQKRPG